MIGSTNTWRTCGRIAGSPAARGVRSRAVNPSGSADFPDVQDLPIVFGSDRRDPYHKATPVVDFYMSAAVKYPWAQDAYFMFPTAYYHYIRGALREFPDETPTNAGPMDSQFAASRDGITWERYDRPAVRAVGDERGTRLGIGARDPRARSRHHGTGDVHVLSRQRLAARLGSRRPQPAAAEPGRSGSGPEHRGHQPAHSQAGTGSYRSTGPTPAASSPPRR